MAWQSGMGRRGNPCGGKCSAHPSVLMISLATWCARIFPRVRNSLDCSRVLITSSGQVIKAAVVPAIPPANRCCAGCGVDSGLASSCNPTYPASQLHQGPGTPDQRQRSSQGQLWTPVIVPQQRPGEAHPPTARSLVLAQSEHEPCRYNAALCSAPSACRMSISTSIDVGGSRCGCRGESVVVAVDVSLFVTVDRRGCWCLCRPHNADVYFIVVGWSVQVRNTGLHERCRQESCAACALRTVAQQCGGKSQVGPCH